MVRVLSFDSVDAEVVAAPQSHQAINNPNLQHGMSRALSCYPIVVQLARSLDLNSLDDLSRSCRQFRANLLQYRARLIAVSLRCHNEKTSAAGRLGEALTASFKAWSSSGSGSNEIAQIAGGKIGKCARDLVSDCRQCKKTVCRNCITKQSLTQALRGRHRRLCKACSKVSIFDMNRNTSEQIGNGQSLALPLACVCAEDQWLCSTCAMTMRSADTSYLRGWSWRSRYSTCGGFGAGLGEGNEGVECGRAENCLASSIVEKEVECDTSDLDYSETGINSTKLDGHTWHGSSYNAQEIVGIGGQVKIKFKKMITVGAIVQEHEDERMHGNYLHYERANESRSWCSWCRRVIPSTKDRSQLLDSNIGLISSSSV